MRVAALFASHRAAHVVRPGGEMLTINFDAVGVRLGSDPVLVAHVPLTKARLGDFGANLSYLDVLELFAFVHPGRFLVPSVVGLAQALDLPPPADMDDYPMTLLDVAGRLLDDLAAFDLATRQGLLELGVLMGQGGKGWPWAPFVIAALEQGGGLPSASGDLPGARDVFGKILGRLPALDMPGAREEHTHNPVSLEDAQARLNLLLHRGMGSEDREDQRKYVAAVTQALRPPAQADDPNLMLIEAGTGIGKTLGYLAPATVWAEQNDAPVWISTYTKNLQKQLDQELFRLPLQGADRDRYAVTRKGRENYLCLLNFAEYAAGAALRPGVVPIVAAGLLARWISMTRDGDFTGVDYPGWLTSLLGVGHTTMLADRRGECIHAGCEFFDRCFVERSIRKAQQARIVLANHTLVMIEAARPDADDRLPGYFIFDEGHHLLDAADNTFSVAISLLEGYDLRRWIIGAEAGRKSRLKGLKRRLEDLCAGDEARALIDQIIHAAACLPSEQATAHLRDEQPTTTMERVLLGIARQVQARATRSEDGYSQETPVAPLDEALLIDLEALRTDLSRLQGPMRDLISHIKTQLEDQAGDLATETRQRLQSALMGLERRATQVVGAWLVLLDDVLLQRSSDDFVDWLEITRNGGKVQDIGLFRHWRNPMIPFSHLIRQQMKSGVVTSATLRDRLDEEGWQAARAVTGADLISSHPVLQAFPSPFDYAAQTRVLVVTDVAKGRIEELAGAFKALFLAAGGGALGLFTAIARLRAVQDRIACDLEASGLQLYAQHVDRMDNGTLVDLFRADTHACLLGTDAMRDGVDVPGESLRLLVYDRVPWPQARLLHKARRMVFGGRVYDEQMTRLRLKQAYGRLIRRQDDRGVFVMLDSALPSRLHDAFPPGVGVERVSLADACSIVKSFFHHADR